MSISRLYLGVHSPADVIAGLIPGVVLLLLFLTLDDWIYSCISSSSHWGKFRRRTRYVFKKKNFLDNKRRLYLST